VGSTYLNICLEGRKGKIREKDCFSFILLTSLQKEREQLALGENHQGFSLRSESIFERPESGEWSNAPFAIFIAWLKVEM